MLLVEHVEHSAQLALHEIRILDGIIVLVLPRLIFGERDFLHPFQGHGLVARPRYICRVAHFAGYLRWAHWEGIFRYVLSMKS